MSEDPLRVLAWNVNHRTCRKPISKAMQDFILSLRPDIVVLTEYVQGPDDAAFCGTLKAAGPASQFHTLMCGRRSNQVLIASRSTATSGTIEPPDRLPRARANFLHVSIENPSLDVIGLRVPSYTRAEERRSYWDWLEVAIRPLIGCPALVVGDLNVDPRGSSSPGNEHLRRLEVAGWQLPNAEGTGSTSRPGEL